MKKTLYWALQLTWGLPLNLIGAVSALLFARRRAYFFHGARVAFWQKKASMAIGGFIFLEKGMHPQEEARVLYHEYGHTLQSILLGPFYLPVIALPSLIWAGSRRCHMYRLKRGKSYYEFYPERWADRLGLPYREV